MRKADEGLSLIYIIVLSIHFHISYFNIQYVSIVRVWSDSDPKQS